jgi:hypothetical protein
MARTTQYLSIRRNSSFSVSPRTELQQQVEQDIKPSSPASYRGLGPHGQMCRGLPKLTQPIWIHRVSDIALGLHLPCDGWPVILCLISLVAYG